MCCSEKAGTLAGGSRMRAGVHPVSSGLRQAACSHRPRVSTPAARSRAHRLHPGPFPCSCLLRHLENGEVMVGAEGHQPLQPLISPVQQQL